MSITEQIQQHSDGIKTSVVGLTGTGDTDCYRFLSTDTAATADYGARRHE